MSADDTVAVRRAVHSGVEQIGAHELLGVRNWIRSGPELTVTRLPGRDGTRRDGTVLSGGSVGLAPPRLGEAARVGAGRRVAAGGTAERM